MKTRNGIAATLAKPFFRQRRIKPRKGKGSYSRKGQPKAGPFDSSNLLLRLTTRSDREYG